MGAMRGPFLAGHAAEPEANRPGLRKKMNILRFAKHVCGKVCYGFLSHAPASLEKKCAMVADVMSADWRQMRKISPMAVEIGNVPDFDTRFAGLDADSMATLRRFIAKLHLLPDAPHLYSRLPPCMLEWGGLCSREEWNAASDAEKRLEKLKERKHLANAEASSLIHHHGLRHLPGKVLSYLGDTVFVDGGAFEGDSTLVFLHYSPRVVWAFEPSPPNREAFRETMRLNGVAENAVRLFPQGLSEKSGTVRFSAQAAPDCSLTGRGGCTADLVPLDSLAPPVRIGLIKADLEGMGMSMLRGAVRTIQRDKPVLALSIYHNADEFLNTYPFLRGLGLDYGYKVLSLCPPWENHELTLLAWPRAAE